MRRIAIVGSGVAGLSAAYAASKHARVTLFEVDDRLGGHADTHVVDGLAIDTGFIVHNERTYPTLLRIFRELDVPTQESEMSMSMRSDTDRLEWAGALGLRGVFAHRNALRPRFLRMLREIPRFHRRARKVLANQADGRTLAQFLEGGNFTPYFRRHYMTPLVAAVWSCDPDIALDYPARYLFEFLSHHGMLQIFGSPTWRTVTGGSQAYVHRIAEVLESRGSEIRLGTKITSVEQTPTDMKLTDGNGEVHSFDAVVLATHPQQSLSMLADPTPVQHELLSAMPYSRNRAQLHTDTSVLPLSRRAWASWNHLERPDAGKVTVTYDLTRLMRLPTSTHYLVSLGAEDLVDQDAVLATMDYEHPVYSPASVAAQHRHLELETDRLVLAGAWQGWGFHEDGARAGVQAAARLGAGWDASPATTGRYATTITHTRREPIRKHYSLRSTFWVVDLDDLPDHGFLGRFESRDHLGDPGQPIRKNVENLLALHGVDADGRILMAANARAFGHCFNPITVFWCERKDGTPAATVVEVHNTYGDRHAYVVHPDAAGRATVDKQMYVSPFYGVDGDYDILVPPPTERLTIGVRLRSEGAVFDASLRGVRSDLSLWRTAPSSLRGAALIRLHGIALWLRRLPIRPRPTHHQEGVK